MRLLGGTIGLNKFFDKKLEVMMDLNEEQKAKAQSLADAVGDEPGKYFSGILKAATDKYFNKVGELLKSGKLKFAERYPEISQQAEQALAELEIVKEAYRLWYEKSGKNLIDKEKTLLKGLFDQGVDRLQFFGEAIKYAAEKTIEKYKKE